MGKGGGLFSLEAGDFEGVDCAEGVESLRWGRGGARLLGHDVVNSQKATRTRSIVRMIAKGESPLMKCSNRVLLADVPVAGETRDVVLE